MLDDEEPWAEFETELEARHLKTGLGIEGMFSNFLADKSKKKQQELEEEEARGVEIRDVSNNNNLFRLPTSSACTLYCRLTPDLTPASSVTTDRLSDMRDGPST